MTNPAKKILIVDDEPDIVVALAAMLQDAGYVVSTPHDGEQLESVLAREQPQLILLDMLLSGRDGREIVRQLKGQTATRDVPILMLSAYPAAAREALAAGADDFLAKPFDLDELLQKVTAHIA
jgi:DNA-binding response OmpR family regulator